MNIYLLFLFLVLYVIPVITSFVYMAKKIIKKANCKGSFTVSDLAEFFLLAMFYPLLPIANMQTMFEYIYYCKFWDFQLWRKSK